MDSGKRRLLLSSSVGAVSALMLPPFAHAAAPAAKPPAQAATESPSVWMDKWIKQWKRDARDVEGVLYLGRFADPIYFLTKKIQWIPNRGQQSALPRGVTVPVGFVTDFASIPRAFWSLLRPDGNYAYAAVLHDYLYWSQITTRQESDRILKFAMEDFKIPRATVKAIYEAVDKAGGSAWRDNAALKAKGEKRILKTFPSKAVTYWSEYKKNPKVFS